MAEEDKRLIFLDSSVLIEYFRKSKKENTFFYNLQFMQEYRGFICSGVVQLVVYEGVNDKQRQFWDNLFEDFLYAPFGKKANETALQIQQQLKSQKRKLELADLIIAATALSLNTPLATLNTRHFININGLSVITPLSL